MQLPPDELFPFPRLHCNTGRDLEEKNETAGGTPEGSGSQPAMPPMHSPPQPGRTPSPEPDSEKAMFEKYALKVRPHSLRPSGLPWGGVFRTIVLPRRPTPQ